MDGALAKARFPLLRLAPDIATSPREVTQDVDVDLLHGGFLRQAKQRAPDLSFAARLLAAAASDGAWQLKTSKGEIAAPIVVNAAGAWADVVAAGWECRRSG